MIKQQVQYLIRSLTQPFVIARLIGNLGNILGYFLVLNVDPLLGSIVKVISLLLCIPFCVKIKLWDVVILFGIFMAIDLHNIYTLVM